MTVSDIRGPEFTYLGQSDVCKRTWRLPGTDLTGLSNSDVKLFMAPKGSETLKINDQDCVIETAYDSDEDWAEVSYTFDATESGTAGIFRAYFVIAHTDGPQTYPRRRTSLRDRYLWVHIKEKIS